MSSQLKGLYLLTDHDQQQDSTLLDEVEQALAAGVSLLQYRDKTGNQAKRLRQAEKLRELTHNYRCLFLVNDDVALAQAVDADGVHLGQDDGAIADARKRLGPDKLIGASCYNQLSLAHQAAADGADYLAFGRFFPSTTKPGAIQANPALLREAKQAFDHPLVAIGGITPDNAAGLVSAGADMLAVINSIYSSNNIAATVRHFLTFFESQDNV